MVQRTRYKANTKKGHKLDQKGSKKNIRIKNPNESKREYEKKNGNQLQVKQLYNRKPHLEQMK